MPVLPPNDFRTQPVGPIGGRRASAEDFDQGNYGSAFQAGARALQGEGERRAERARAERVFEAEKSVQGEQHEARSWFDEYKRSAPADNEGFLEGVKSELEDRRARLVESIEDPELMDRMTLRLQEVHQNVLKEAEDEHEKASTARLENDLRQIFGRNENRAGIDPQSVVHLFESERELLRASPDLTPRTRADILARRSEVLWGTALDGMVGRIVASPGMTADKIQESLDGIQDEKGPWFNYAPPEVFERGRKTLLQAKDRLVEQDRAAATSAYARSASKLVASAFEESMRRLETGGPDDPRFSAERIEALPLDDERKERLLSRRREAEEVRDFTKELGGSSLPELRAAVEELGSGALVDSNRSTERRGHLLRRMLQREEKAWKADPVQYLLERNADLRTLRKSWESTQDPTTLQAYAEAVVLQQQRIDPEAAPRLVDKGSISRVAEAMRDIRQDPAGPSQALEVLRSEAQIWGKYAPLVMKEYREAGVLNAGQALAGMNFDDPDPKRAPFWEDLVRASSGNLEELSKLLPEGSKTTARELVVESIRPLVRTLESSLDGADILSDFVNAGQQYVAFKAASTGKNSKEDLKAFSEEFARKSVLDRYEWRDDETGRFRIPREINADAIDRGVEDVMTRQVGAYGFRLPRELAGLEGAEIEASYLDSLRSFGRFVNTGDETGLRLLDEHGRQVYRKDGKPYRWTWEELEFFGVEPRPLPSPKSGQSGASAGLTRAM